MTVRFPYTVRKHSCHTETNFKGWIYTIMRNIFINNYRKTLRDQTYVDNTDNQFFLNLGVDIEDDSMQALMI